MKATPSLFGMFRNAFTILAILALTPHLLAPPPGGGNGGGGRGGGGDDPPADPAIAFIDDGAVWVMNDDGSNQTRVFADGRVDWVSWSPDGTRFAIHAEVGGVQGIWTIGADGSNLQLVKATHWTSYLWDLQWSPVPTADGQEKILFIELTDEGEEGTYDVFAVNPDGTGLVHLVDTPVPFMETGCTWSPDASRIAVVEESTDSIVVYDLGLVDGSLAVVGAEVIAGTPPDVDDIEWARTQSKVAVASFVGGSSDNNELWIVDLDDPANHRQITFFERQDRVPTWAPDDSFLAFMRYPRPRNQLGLRKLGSDGQTDVSLGAKNGARPDWRR